MPSGSEAEPIKQKNRVAQISRRKRAIHEVGLMNLAQTSGESELVLRPVIALQDLEERDLMVRQILLMVVEGSNESQKETYERCFWDLMNLSPRYQPQVIVLFSLVGGVVPQRHPFSLCRQITPHFTWFSASRLQGTVP